MEIRKHQLPLLQKLVYVTGHGCNDLISGVHWSFYFIYMHIVLQFKASEVGYFMFAAQIADATGQMLVGVLSNFTDGCCGLGKYKAWYLWGTILSTTGFLTLYIMTIDESNPARFVYYLLVTVTFALPVGIVYTTHLSILTKISGSELERVQLNGWRIAMQVVCNVTVYVVAWLLLYMHKGSNSTDQLSADDRPTFRNIVISCAVLAVVYSTIFLIFLKIKKGDEVYVATNEEKLNQCKCISFTSFGHSLEACNKAGLSLQTRNFTCSVIASNEVLKTIDLKIQDLTYPREHRLTDTDKGNPEKKTINNDSHSDNIEGVDPVSWLKYTLKSFRFYAVAMTFICTRLAVVIAQLYTPLFVTQSLLMDKVSIALLPLIMYTSGLIASLFMRKISLRLEKTKIFVMGGIITIGGLVWIYFIVQEAYRQIYGAVLILGAGLSITQVTTMASIMDLIGNSNERSFIVLGMIGCVERVVQGVSVLVLQHFSPCSLTASNNCVEFYRTAMVAIPGASTFLAFVIILADKLVGWKHSSAQKTPTYQK